MSKRAGPEDDGILSAKRLKLHDPSDAISQSTQALLRIAEKADELVECLQGLKRQLSHNQANPELLPRQTKDSLSQLCKHLLPSVQVLGSLDAANPGVAERTNVGGKASDASASETRSQHNGPPIPSAVAVTPWVSSEIRPERPDLPEILDPGLAEEAFTHPGLGRPFSYERLEWLGDAYVELISTVLIQETFGRLPSGRCSQLRERLIRNVNLAEYFRHYGMEKWARLPVDFSDGRGPGRGKSSDKDLIKTQADMFEAYVAAIILSDPQHGLATTIAWLKALWGKNLKEDIIRAENKKMASMPGENASDAALSNNAKEQLAQKIAVKGVLIRYKDLPCDKKDKNLHLPLYSIGCFLDGWGEKGKLLAVGTALNKKEAGQKAAEKMLDNKKLMKVYEEKKRQYMEAREAEAAKE